MAENISLNAIRSIPGVSTYEINGADYDRSSEPKLLESIGKTFGTQNVIVALSDPSLLAKGNFVVKGETSVSTIGKLFLVTVDKSEKSEHSNEAHLEEAKKDSDGDGVTDNIDSTPDGILAAASEFLRDDPNGVLIFIKC